MKQAITVAELIALLESGEPNVLIDTHPPEYFQQAHLPGASNACVYEMTFLDTVAGIVASPDTPIVVYGSSDRSQAGVVACRKLAEAGYRNVRELSGGLKAWQTAGIGLEPDAVCHDETPAALRDGTYHLDTKASRLEWIGRNLNNRHYGIISVAEGSVKIAGGLISGGSVTLDMHSIVNLDLRDEAYNRMLISHLKSDDFFHVERYPTATFRLDSSKTIPEAAPGSPGQIVTGSLELKGSSNQLSFPVEIAAQENGHIKAHAAFDIDRTRWGVLYGSGRFFEKLGMHLVSDTISIELFLVTEPA
ncbi:MAG: YceI family protein [Desulfuromonadales bacterium]|nr:YceI family protein [Desulfuromonadales bacterium]